MIQKREIFGELKELHMVVGYSVDLPVVSILMGEEC